MSRNPIPTVGDPTLTQMSGYITGQQGAHQASYSQHYGAGDPSYTYPLLQSGNSTTHLLMRRDEANTTNFPVDTLDVNRMPTITSNYSVTARDMNKVLLADCSSGDLTFTLAPAANVSSNFRCVVKRIDDSPNKVIIATTSGDLIDNKEQFELICSYEYLGFGSNLSDYYVYARTSPHPNLLINGALDYWPEDPALTIVGVGSKYIAGIFKLFNSVAGVTLTHSRSTRTFGDTLLPDEVTYYSTVTPSGTFSSSTPWQLAQYTDDIVQWSGKIVTYSVWANFGSSGSSIISASAALQYDSVTPATLSVSSSAQNVVTGWKKYTFTMTLPTLSGHSLAGSPFLSISLNVAGDYESAVSFTMIKCEFSDKATRWIPKPLMKEIDDMAYYFHSTWRSGLYVGSNSHGTSDGILYGFGNGPGYGNQQTFFNHAFPRRMRKPPVVIPYSLNGTINKIDHHFTGFPEYTLGDYDCSDTKLNFINVTEGLETNWLMSCNCVFDARF